MHVSKNNVLSSALTSQQSSSSTHSLKLIFRFPESAQTLRSLRHQLLDCPSADVPLAHKLRLAREISKSVSYVHSFAFVHKNIRPESISSFESSFHATDDQIKGGLLLRASNHQWRYRTQTAVNILQIRSSLLGWLLLAMVVMIMVVVVTGTFMVARQVGV